MRAAMHKRKHPQQVIVRSAARWGVGDSRPVRATKPVHGLHCRYQRCNLVRTEVTRVFAAERCVPPEPGRRATCRNPHFRQRLQPSRLVHQHCGFRPCCIEHHQLPQVFQLRRSLLGRQCPFAGIPELLLLLVNVFLFFWFLETALHIHHLQNGH